MGKKRNYCNNADLTRVLVEWQENCRAAEGENARGPQIPNYVGLCIDQICNRLTRGFGFNFTQYSYRDEMIADAIERCCYACYKFDARRSNAFNYLTTVAINAMKKRINDEKKQNAVKHKNFQALYMTGEFEGMAPNELSDKVIEDYENKLQRKAEASEKKPLTAKKKISKTKASVDDVFHKRHHVK